MLRSLLQTWLQNVAKAKVREAVTQAAKEQLAGPADAPPLLANAGAIKPCHVGFVFALGIESGSLEDRLAGRVTIRGDGFVAHEGGLGGRRAVVLLSVPDARMPPERPKCSSTATAPSGSSRPDSPAL